MKKVAIIPLRKGSKGIPGKNKKKLLGRALYQWTLGEAIFSDLDKIYVFTDDEEILSQIKNEYNWTEKVECMMRSPESSTDTATTEVAMIEFANNINYNFDLICLIQATSPLLRSSDINIALSKVIDQNYDSVLTVAEQKRFFWTKDGSPKNYDFLNRPRRQDFQADYVENGAFYAAKKKVFMENKNRIGGNIALSVMPEESLFEIDEPSDWIIVEKLLEKVIRTQKEYGKKIKAMVFDVDGVFTDSKVAVGDHSELFKTFSLRDGMGFELLRQNQILPIVMTSEDSPIVARRMNKLKIGELHLGVKDKYSRLTNVLQQVGISRSEVAYIGDDINDLSNILSVGWGITPLDGAMELKNAADITMTNIGGNKVVREAIEFIIKHNTRFN